MGTFFTPQLPFTSTFNVWNGNGFDGDIWVPKQDILSVSEVSVCWIVIVVGVDHLVRGNTLTAISDKRRQVTFQDRSLIQSVIFKVKRGIGSSPRTLSIQ